MPFKIYADSESVLKRVRCRDRKNNASYTGKYQAHIPCSFAYKVVCVKEKVSKPVALYRAKNDLLKQFLKSMIIVKV